MIIIDDCTIQVIKVKNHVPSIYAYLFDRMIVFYHIKKKIA